MKILHVIAGLPSAGGMSELVPLLALEQHRLGHEVVVVTVGNVGALAALDAGRAGVRIIGYRSNWPYFLYCSVEMFFKLRTLVKDADLIHIHGCWTFPVWWGCHLALALRKPFVRSPHGCLAPEQLKISRWKKVLAGFFFDRRYFERAAVIHATAESEAQEVLHYMSGRGVLKRASSKARKLEENDCAREYAKPRLVVIPSGVGSTHDLMNSRTNELPRDATRTRTVLFLSRLHPIKGADLLWKHGRW